MAHEYICNDCEAVFDRPSIEDCSFSHAFGYERQYRRVCPECESPDISDAPDVCPQCGGSMRGTDTLCRSCRKELLSRVCSFFDSFTAEEEQQFDEWMDGNSISDRKKWEVSA